MSDNDLVRVIGRGSNVSVNIDDDAPIAEALDALRSHVAGNRFLYSNGTVAVSVGRRMLRRNELANIKQLLDRETGVTVSRFLGELPTEEAAAEDPAPNPGAPPPEPLPQTSPEPSAISHNDPKLLTSKAISPVRSGASLPAVASPDPESGEALPSRPSARSPNASGAARAGHAPWSAGQAAPQPVAPGKPDRGEEALLIKTTCRSGEVISYPGDIVVLADVNPGAQLIADGDIFVYGALRGVAHAGASGDTKAVIIATVMQAPRLQIGPHVGIAPEGKQGSVSDSSGPRIAYVRRQSVFVQDYAGRFATYMGGTLYDG